MSKVGVKGEKMAKLDFILQIILKWYKKNNFIHNIILKPIKNTEISGDKMMIREKPHEIVLRNVWKQAVLCHWYYFLWKIQRVL